MMRIVKLAFCGLGLLTLTAACSAVDDGLAVAGTTGRGTLAVDGEIRVAVSAGAAGSSAKTREGATSYDYDLLQEECSWPGNENYFRVVARNASNRDSVYIDCYVMYNTLVSERPWRFSTTDGTMKSYYWPASQAYDFFAYAPAMENGAVKEPTVADNGMTYAYDRDNNLHTLTCDLDAQRYGDQEQMKELIYAYETDQTYASQGETGVTLHFQHPLSAIYLKLNSAFEKVKLNSVVFTGSGSGANGIGIYHEGTGTCSTDGTAWEHLEGATASEFTLYVNKVMGESMFIGNIFEKPFLVMPQPLTEREGLEDVVIQINYQKWDDSILPSGGYADEKKVELSITDTVTAWESGKAYVYAIELGKDEAIAVNAMVEAWNDKGNYTEIEVDKDE